MSNRELIREVFIANGFTPKGEDGDLRPYVYKAAEALIERVQTAKPGSKNETMTDAEYIEGIANHYKGKGIFEFEEHHRRLTGIAARLRGEAAQGEQQAVALPAALQKIVDKARRFIETTEDDGSFDIGRDWAGVLTMLGLLVRVQRSPAVWATTSAIDDLIEWASRPQPVAVAGDESAAFDAWFRGEQGTEYNGMWSFARAAWMHRAALSAAPAAPVIPEAARKVLARHAFYIEAHALEDSHERQHEAKDIRDFLAAAPAPVAGDAAPLPSIVREVLEWYASDPSLLVAWNEEGWAAEKAAKASGHYTFVGEDRYGHNEYVPNSVRAEEALAALDEWLAQDRASAPVVPEAKWPVTFKGDGSYRDVTQETLHWRGIPVFVTGRVWTHDANWPLIDTAAAPQPAAPDAQEVR